MSKATGGPAFPQDYREKEVLIKMAEAGEINSQHLVEGSKQLSGMTLRDYFATHAGERDIRHQAELLRDQIYQDGIGVLPDNWTAIARYMHADAMLKARG